MGKLETACWLLAVVLGGAQQWASVDTPSSIDLVSYLDIGDAWLHGHWNEAVNGYWNPLYSWILGAVLAVVRPSARYEYPAVEGVDFLIFLFALGSFAWLLRGVRRSYQDAIARLPGNQPAISDWAWVLGGYTLFIWSSVKWITLSANSPDMCAAGLAYCAFGLLVRLDERERDRGYLVLGVVLALGYLSRTPMLPVGVAMLLLMGWQARTSSRRRGVVVAGLVVVALASPNIVAISHARGRLTIGDNGKLNHAWLANPRPWVIPNRYWQGGPVGSGTPVHPVRVLWDEPATYEFGTPIGGTYPPWTDPSYWYEGLTYHFDAAAEWETLKSNASFYYYMFGRWILLVLLVPLLAVGDLRSTFRTVCRNARYWVPPVVGLALYLGAVDLHVQMMKLQPPHRYVAAYVVLLCMTLASSVRFRRTQIPTIAKRTAALALVVTSLGMLSQLAGGVWTALTAEPATPPWRITRALEDRGIRPGMRIATIGHPDCHEYWARLARVRIVADVPDNPAFWAASQEVRDLILERLARAGAGAVVSAWIPEGNAPSGWRRADGTAYAVRLLNDAKPPPNSFDNRVPGR